MLPRLCVFFSAENSSCLSMCFSFLFLLLLTRLFFLLLFLKLYFGFETVSLAQSNLQLVM